jgi:hypothetical protein
MVIGNSVPEEPPGSMFRILSKLCGVTSQTPAAMRSSNLTFFWPDDADLYSSQLLCHAASLINFLSRNVGGFF